MMNRILKVSIILSFILLFMLFLRLQKRIEGNDESGMNSPSFEFSEFKCSNFSMSQEDGVTCYGGDLKFGGEEDEEEEEDDDD